MKYYKISEKELRKFNQDDWHDLDLEFFTDTGLLEIKEDKGYREKTSLQFEELKDGLDINKLEGAVWHGCPKTHAHTEFSELKFKGTSMISGFCIHCEEEMVRLEIKE